MNFRKIKKHNEQLLRELSKKENPTKPRRKVYVCVNWDYALRGFTIWDDFETRNVIMRWETTSDEPFFSLGKVVQTLKDYEEKNHLRMMEFSQVVQGFKSKHIHIE